MTGPTGAASASSLPRILCLHGGGTSASIFNIQTVRIQRALKDHFKFVFLDGPFSSDPGPGVAPFFEDMGPFYRWARRQQDEHGERVQDAIMRKLKEPGGPFVGVLGFSQGATVAAGLLHEQQRRATAGEPGTTQFRFAILAMGGHPILYLSTGPPEQPELPHREFDDAKKGSIKIPTIHVHGLQDQFVANGKLLLQYFDPESSKLLEFDVEHRLPITKEDNDLLAKTVLHVYRASQLDY